jgi:hypothetical protein
MIDNQRNAIKSKSKRFEIAIALIVLVIGPCTAVWAQEKKNDIFNITPAFSFAWYPSANFFEEESTKTEVDRNNFGMSVIMGLKLFDKVGAHLNLKIDDPTFKKLVDVAGFVTAYYFMLKFDYHSFGGTVTWAGNTPNPISGEVYNFRNDWTNVSLLFRVDQLRMSDKPSIPELFLFELLQDFRLVGEGNLGAIGIGYARYDMPLEYRVQPDSGLHPGFGLVKGEAWGFSILWDTLIWRMEPPAFYGGGIMDLMQFIWIYLDWFVGLSFIGKEETDAQAIAWMSNANNGVSVDGNIKPTYGIVKANLGLQYVWDVGKKGRIGLAVGVELLEETIKASNDDINIYFWSRNIGPAVRVSARW